MMHLDLPLSGFLLIDKPPAMTSHDVVYTIKHQLKCKIGHCGTLDPLATGALPICVGSATKLSDLIMCGRKRYDVTAKLGIVTDSDDSQGKIISQHPIPHDWSLSTLRQILPQFIGTIDQLPPQYAAIKRKGKPLYYWARQGIAITVPHRQVNIDHIEILTIDDKSFSLRIQCGKGTYIRSIVRDIGQILGCGAHVTTLRRTYVEPFGNQAMVALSDVSLSSVNHQLIDNATALAHRPQMSIADHQVKALFQGKPIICETLHPEDTKIILLHRGRIMALSQYRKGHLHPKKCIELNSSYIDHNLT